MIKRLLKNVFVLIVMISMASSIVFGSINEKYDKGVVEWDNNIIRVIGYGAPPTNASEATAQLLAVRAAKVDAMRNALEIIENVRVSSATTMEMMMLTSDQVKTSVQGYIKGGQFDEPVFDPKGSCSIVLILPLNGQSGLSATMLNAAKLRATTAKPETQFVVNSTPVASHSVTTLSKPYTGIIIDARSVGVKPALYPQIFDVDGQLLYGPTLINTKQVDFTTMVGYSRSMEKALTMQRVGDNPLKLTATSSVKTINGENTDIVLDSEATKVFRSAVSQADILAQSAVVIIIN